MVVDVFSRMAFVVPMKNKTASVVNTATEEILDQTEPTMISSDNGLEFSNNEFKKLMRNRGIAINFVDVGDHRKLGLVDRFIRTMRTKINKYIATHRTTNYIEVLPNLIDNYTSLSFGN